MTEMDRNMLPPLDRNAVCYSVVQSNKDPKG